jgi:hypothetical protein
MARTTHVAKAQQRYETVPVIDPTTGEAKKTPVMRNGEQRTTKRGKPIFMTVTVQDRSKPLPPYECDYCNKTIEVGTPYKHITPKSGPYGGRKRTRHESCPGWMPWDYSNSLSAQVGRIAYDFGNAIANVDDPDDVKSMLDDAATEVREIAEQKREGASNIEEGFGHPTSASEELESIADELDGWADEIENADVPDLPDVEDEECDECGGSGNVENPEYDREIGEEDGESYDPDYAVEEEIECEACEGTGYTTPDEPNEDQMSQWRDEVVEATSIVDECPV